VPLPFHPARSLYLYSVHRSQLPDGPLYTQNRDADPMQRYFRAENVVPNQVAQPSATSTEIRFLGSKWSETWEKLCEQMPNSNRIRVFNFDRPLPGIALKGVPKIVPTRCLLPFISAMPDVALGPHKHRRISFPTNTANLLIFRSSGT
jgi:hypothetical protein